MLKRVIAMVLVFSIVQMTTGFLYGEERVLAKEGGQKMDLNQKRILGDTSNFLLANQENQAMLYVDEKEEEWSSDGTHSYCGMSIIADKFADDVKKVTGKKCQLTSEVKDLKGNVIIAGTLGQNDMIDTLVNKKIIDASGLYKDGKKKWDCYQMQFVSGSDLSKAGFSGISQALVITGSNKRGAMYGLFHISEKIGVSAWVYMADAVPNTYEEVYLSKDLLEFNDEGKYLSKEPSIKYRGFFINDEAPSFTGWANKKFGGLNEKCYENIFELLIRMKANYLWPAMWGNIFSEEGKSFKLANVVLADAYGVCMGTSHHEACYRAGEEWQRIYKNYGSSNAWNYSKNRDAIYKFWKDGVKRNGNYEGTITMGMRGEADSALAGGAKENIDLLKTIITDQNEIISDYIKENPNSKAKDSLKIYIPYSENEEYYYGPDDGSIKGLNVWEGMDDVTIMLTDDNYGNIRSLPEEKVRNREAGWGLYYHLDGHVGTGAYEWVSSTQLEHIWDQLTMAYDYNVRNIWVINVGDVKPVEMELNYAMDLAYDMDKWGKENTAKTYRENWIQNQLGGKENCSDEVAKGVAETVADFLKISTYRKPEYVKSSLYSVENYKEAERDLSLCEKTIKKANQYYEYFKGTKWDDAFYQTVYYQAVGTANVTRMQIFKAFDDFYVAQKSSLANRYAALVNECIAYDKELTDYYNTKMSGGKWKNMMSSPHVGFVTWNSDGWKYPKASTVTLLEGSKMIVSPDGTKTAYSQGNASLPTFYDTDKNTYCLTMSNGGKVGYSYQVSTGNDWIVIKDAKGDRVSGERMVQCVDTLYVSVDWSKVKQNQTGEIVLKSEKETVKVAVEAEKTTYTGKDEKIHIESNDVVTIDAKEYSSLKSADGVSWKEIEGYGRYESAMKMFPTTVSFAKPNGKTHKTKMGNVTRTVTEFDDNFDAPYIEYKFYVDEDADYNFTMYTAPINNIFKPSDWGYVPIDLYYGIQVDDLAMQKINSLPDGKYISYAADGDNKWKDGIMNNIHVSTSSEKISKGVHTVKIYGMHAGLAVERLVISNKKLKTSYLGPDKTFFKKSENDIPAEKQGTHFEMKDDEPDPEKKSELNAPVAVETQTPNLEQSTPMVTNKNQTSKTTVKKGKTYTYKKGKYKVTKVTKSGGTATYMAPLKKTVKSIKIYGKIKLKGKIYKVTAIYKKAFKGCKKLKKITTTKALDKKYKKLLKKSLA